MTPPMFAATEFLRLILAISFEFEVDDVVKGSQILGDEFGLRKLRPNYAPGIRQRRIDPVKVCRINSVASVKRSRLTSVPQNRKSPD